MNNMVVKDVEFNGAMLRAAQVQGIVYVGIAWVCSGLGLSEDRSKYEKRKVQRDLVLNQGVKFYPLGTGNSNSELLCLMIDYLPLWLAKISITPTMKRENPELVDRLIEYQLKAKDILAEAFLGKKSATEGNTIQLQLPDMPDYTEQFAEINRRFDTMYDDMGKLVRLIESIRTDNIQLKDTSLPLVKDGAYEWKQYIYDKMFPLIGTEKFQNKGSILQYIYKYMNRNYSVVWEQEMKEYVERNNSVTKPSTIDVVYDNETYRSIFDAILTDLVENNKRGLPTRRATDVIIQPLVEKYNDTSKYGMVSYRAVYKRMEENYKISWKYMNTKYINKNGTRPLTKADVINSSNGLLQKFTKTVRELLREEN